MISAIGQSRSLVFLIVQSISYSIFKHFVKTVELMSLKFCMIIELITLHLECIIAQVKYSNFSYAHAQTFVLLNGATVSTGFRKLKFWLGLLWTVFYLKQTGF